MKTKSSITIKNKIYPYTLERATKGAIRFVSKDAKIAQEFLAEDLSEIILDLPNLILAEQEYVRKRSDVIRFRVSGTDKARNKKRQLKKDMIQYLAI